MKTRWIRFVFIGLFLTTSAFAEKSYFDYLNQVEADLYESETQLSRDVQALGVRYTDIADDDDFSELKAKTVLLWVVQECHALATLYTQQPDTLALSPRVSSLPDFKEVAKERANQASIRALNFSVEAAQLEYQRQNVTAQLFLERMKSAQEAKDSLAVLERRKELEEQIDDLLYKELSLHEAIPMAYIEAALHVAVAAYIRKDLGEIQEAEETMAAFDLLMDSAVTTYANALVFFGSTRLDPEELSRGLDAIDGAATVHLNALESAARFL